MLTYREHAPPPALAGAVRTFWTLSGNGTSATADRISATADRILPDGAFELVLHLGDPFVQNGIAQPRAMLVGEIRRPTLVHATWNANVIGVSFHVGGAAEFFDVPMRELRDQIVPLDELFPRGVIPSEVEGSPAARDPSTSLGMTLGAIRRRPENTLAKAAVRIIRERRGNIRVRELAAMLGPAERTIERSFDDAVGMPPKLFARLMRFHAQLADPDSDAGYVDDSHRIHDFREFSGTTPGQYEQEQNAIGAAFAQSEFSIR